MTTTRVTLKQLLVICLASQFALFSISGGFAADDTEPIAYIGHGAFFDRDGKQIKLTQDFIEKAQAYYRQRLLASMPPDKVAGFLEVEKGLVQTLRLQTEFLLLAALVTRRMDRVDDFRSCRQISRNTAGRYCAKRWIRPCPQTIRVVFRMTRK